MSDTIDRRRFLADRAATVIATIGGLSVIVVLALMFLFLLREALPLAESARLLSRSASLVAEPARAPDASAHPVHGLRLVPMDARARVLASDGTGIASLPVHGPALLAWTYSGGGVLVADRSGLQRHPLYRDATGAWQLAPPVAYALDAGPVNALAASPAAPHFAVLAGQELLLYRDGNRGPAARLRLDVPGQALRWQSDGRGIDVRGSAGVERVAVVDDYPSATLGSLWLATHRDYAASPEHLWQATADPPAFSLAPLTWGTLKAAFLGMLFGAPVGVLAAIHVAYFARARLRSWVKPTIELMEGLPTVMLGMVAVLVLAPALERHILGLLVTLLALPLMGLLGATVASRLVRRAGPMHRDRLPIVMVPMLALVILGCFGLGQLLDQSFPGGFVTWLEVNHGWNYAARNSLLVGLVVGLAIMPSIFTLAEDAVFGVPERLSRSAFALGATRWQALVGIVLPMASPGIAAALVIGFARGIGETMIVMMVSGNTPLLEGSLWSGLRSLAANLAIELPETTPGSEHYRVLFLSATLLFLGTFALNATADWVRAWLQRRYRVAT